MLPAFLEQHPAVRLVVVDSVTFHFRHDFRDMMQRSRVLSQMAQDLMQLAEGHDIAVGARLVPRHWCTEGERYLLGTLLSMCAA